LQRGAIDEKIKKKEEMEQFEVKFCCSVECLFKIPSGTTALSCMISDAKKISILC